MNATLPPLNVHMLLLNEKKNALFQLSPKTLWEWLAWVGIFILILPRGRGRKHHFAKARRIARIFLCCFLKLISGHKPSGTFKT